MTAVDVLRDTVRAARRFRYIPDGDGKNYLADEWDTAQEVEARGGCDCDGASTWTVQRGQERAELDGVTPLGEWRVVAGEVYQVGAWRGHMWVALVVDGIEWWADPSWGIPPGTPAALGWHGLTSQFTTRRPVAFWTHVGGGDFDRQQDYERGPA